MKRFLCVGRETLVLAGRGQQARELLESLPKADSYDRVRRALLFLRIGVETDDDDLAGKYQQTAGDSAEASLLRARWFAARGKVVAARREFANAERVASQFVEVKRRLALMELDLLRVKPARAAIAKALRRAPRDPGVVSVATSVYIADKDLNEAERVIANAMTALPGDGRLLAAKGSG